MHPVPRRNARMQIAAGRPRVDLHKLEVVDAAPPHGRLPAWVFLGDAHRRHDVREADGRLPGGDAFHGDRAGGQIHHRVEAAVGRRPLRMVVAEEPHLARNRRTRRETLQRLLRRFHQGRGTEGRLRPEFGLGQRRGALDLLRRERFERMRAFGKFKHWFGHG